MGKKPEEIAGQFYAFIYAFEAKRTFQTLRCPSIRIMAFSERGEKIFDKVITGLKFVKIPPTRLVIESHPDTDISALVEDIQRLGVSEWVEAWHRKRMHVDGGTTNKDDGDVLYTLFREVLVNTAEDMKLGIDAMGGKYDKSSGIGIHRRAQMIDAAAYLLGVVDEVPFTIPPQAIEIANDILEHEKSRLIHEVRAAAIAGLPWMATRQGLCCLCNGLAWYRPVIEDPELPEEVAWRLQRPENHVLVCSPCFNSLVRSLDHKKLLLAFAHLTWGVRFIALRKWYQGFTNDLLPPEWNMDDYPLWPKEYGGPTWMTGSGALQHCAPRWNLYPNLHPEHQVFHDTIWTTSNRPRSNTIRQFFVVMDDVYKDPDPNPAIDN